ncbi:hypothetical protein V6N11_058482 [Hibiscus sabdariffa]|uniref:Cytochrome c assembly protein domain-containing protein n=1 Tax=Hibiscus sabdariffa TaxID=183260 RepID=A0ABR2U556_9ROSI
MEPLLHSLFREIGMRQKGLYSRLLGRPLTMAIYLSLRVAPLDLQQGGNYCIPYVHVPAAQMSILVYIATAINTFLFLLTKHPLFLHSSHLYSNYRSMSRRLVPAALKSTYALCSGSLIRKIELGWGSTM